MGLNQQPEFSQPNRKGWYQVWYQSHHLEMLFDLVCDLQDTELNLTAEKPWTSLTGRSASCGKCCLQTRKRSASDVRNRGTVFDLQASAFRGFFPSEFVHCRSCVLSATSTWKRRVLSGYSHIWMRKIFATPVGGVQKDCVRRTVSHQSLTSL